LIADIVYSLRVVCPARHRAELSPRLGQRARARVNGVLAQQLLNAQKLVVFRQPIRAAQRTGLDLTRAAFSTGGRAEANSYQLRSPDPLLPVTNYLPFLKHLVFIAAGHDANPAALWAAVATNQAASGFPGISWVQCSLTQL